MRGSRFGDSDTTALATNNLRFATISAPRRPHPLPASSSHRAVFYLSLWDLLPTTQLPCPLPNSTLAQPLARTLYHRFEAAKGSKVTTEDLAKEDLEDEDVEAVSSQSQSSANGGWTPSRKGKGKNKAARLNACQKLVGAGVRKYFPRYDEEFDGEVSSYLPPESDDEHGDLWLIKYEDGDSEHFDPEELTKARALYNKRYALAKKVVTYPTNARFGGHAATNLSQGAAKVTVFGETPLGPRGVCCTIRGYR
ncbi:unnamed protein product [Ectocarpus fasciculatus]